VLGEKALIFESKRYRKILLPAPDSETRRELMQMVEG